MLPQQYLVRRGRRFYRRALCHDQYADVLVSFDGVSDHCQYGAGRRCGIFVFLSCPLLRRLAPKGQIQHRDFARRPGLRRIFHDRYRNLCSRADHADRHADYDDGRACQ